MLNKFPKRSGIYHIRDNIEHLEVKVSLRYVRSLLNLPEYSVDKKDLAQRKRTADHLENASEDEIESITIRWQQKVLSAKESEFYRNPRNCTTDVHKKYHQWLKQTDDLANKSDGRISKSKKRARKQVKSKDGLNGNATISLGKTIFTYVDEDDFPAKGEEEEWKKTRPEQMPTKSMYIYAALHHDTQIVALKWYAKRRLLQIYPDFNNFQDNPYFIEIDVDYRHLYAYSIENVSKCRQIEPESALNFLYLPELATHEHTDSSDKFAMPPKRMRRCTLLLELQDAVGFEYDNIHVRYHIQLPPNTLLEEGLLEASTHSASSSTSSVGDHTNIGYNWQLTVLSEEQYDPSDLLYIFFEVISIDSWDRERVEGFAHYATSLTQAKKDSVWLQCMRPIDSFWNALHRYFIGDRKSFDFVSFFTHSKCDGSDSTQFHCRYHIRMRNTGRLRMLCQSVTQRNCELLQPCANRSSGMTLEDIMQAYREALKRLEATALQ